MNGLSFLVLMKYINEIPQSSNDIIEIIKEIEYEKHRKSVHTTYTYPIIKEKLIQKTNADKIVTLIRRGGFYKNWNNRDNASRIHIRVFDVPDYLKYNYYSSFNLLTYIVNNPFLYESRELQNKKGHYFNNTAVYTRTAIPLRHITNNKAEIEFSGIRTIIVPGNWYIYDKKENIDYYHNILFRR